MQFLQSKALCIMPISLASAIYQTQPPDTSSIVKPESNPPSQTLGKGYIICGPIGDSLYAPWTHTLYILFNPHKFSCSPGSNCNQSQMPQFLLFSFLLAFVKTGFDVNALKNASRPFMSCQVPSKGEEIVKTHLICSSFLYQWWGIVGNDGSTFVVGLSFLVVGCGTFLKGQSMFHLYICNLYKAQNCVNVFHTFSHPSFFHCRECPRMIKVMQTAIRVCVDNGTRLFKEVCTSQL